MSRSVPLCGRMTSWRNGGPEIRLRTDGTAYVAGLYRCASPWSCMECGPCIADVREAELKELVTRARKRGLNVITISLTIPRGVGEDARVLFRGVSKAWWAFTRGRKWRTLCLRWHIRGTVMGVEATYGLEGWHPSVHALLITRTAVDACAVDWPVLATNWRRAARYGFGRECEPGDTNSVTISPCGVEDVSSYIAKLAFDDRIGSRVEPARPGCRTPWEIALAVAEREDPADVAIWRSWLLATSKQKWLVWDNGARYILGRDEMTDEECVAEPESPTDVVVAKFSAAEWYVLCDYEVDLLEAAEDGGRHAVIELARAIAREACECGDALALRLARDERSAFHGVLQGGST